MPGESPEIKNRNDPPPNLRRFPALENLARLPDIGVAYRLETTGKGTQFGAVEELVSLCKEISTCKLCLDFSHIHARKIGGLKSYADFAAILQYVVDELGPSAYTTQILLRVALLGRVGGGQPQQLVDCKRVGRLALQLPRPGQHRPADLFQLQWAVVLKVHKHRGFYPDFNSSLVSCCISMIKFWLS